MKKKVNLAVLASGRGSNFEAIAEALKQGRLKANLSLLLTDQEHSFVRQRAKRLGIREVFVNPKTFSSRSAFDKKIVRILKKEKVDLVALAGFMRIVSPYFVKKFKNRILNIHPALLPAFKGADAIRRAFAYGCKVTGVTVHFVDEKVDHGPIILQEAISLSGRLTLKELEEKIHSLEHRLYPEAIRLVIEKKLKFRGRKVRVI